MKHINKWAFLTLCILTLFEMSVIAAVAFRQVTKGELELNRHMAAKSSRKEIRDSANAAQDSLKPLHGLPPNGRVLDKATQGYNKTMGQGFYVIVDRNTKEVVYVGRGDAVNRIKTHQTEMEVLEDGTKRLRFDKNLYDGIVIWDNNLPKATSKGLEQLFINGYGGSKKSNPLTKLKNIVRSFHPLNNANALHYMNSIDLNPKILEATLKKLDELEIPRPDMKRMKFYEKL